MGTGQGESLHSVLDALRCSDGAAIEACVLSGRDGLAIASALPPGGDDEHIGALVAAFIETAERISDELARGRLDRMLLHGECGWIVVSDVAEGTVLTVLAHADAKPGRVLLEARRAAERLAALIVPPFPAFSSS